MGKFEQTAIALCMFLLSYVNAINQLPRTDLVPGGGYAPSTSYIDVAFVIDTTQSMGPEIQLVRDTIKTIIESMKMPYTLFRFGVVAYRDHPAFRNQYVTKLFHLSGDAQQAISFVQDLQAKQGLNSNTAALDGLYFGAAQLRWKKNARLKKMFHIAGTPPHGLLFDGKECPELLTIKQVAKEINERDIHYHLLKVRGPLDKMEQQFRQKFKHFESEEIEQNKPASLRSSEQNFKNNLKDVMILQLQRSLVG